MLLSVSRPPGSIGMVRTSSSVCPAATPAAPISTRATRALRIACLVMVCCLQFRRFISVRLVRAPGPRSSAAARACAPTRPGAGREPLRFPARPRARNDSRRSRVPPPPGSLQEWSAPPDGPAASRRRVAPDPGSPKRKRVSKGSRPPAAVGGTVAPGTSDAGDRTRSGFPARTTANTMPAAAARAARPTDHRDRRPATRIGPAPPKDHRDHHLTATRGVRPAAATRRLTWCQTRAGGSMGSRLAASV